ALRSLTRNASTGEFRWKVSNFRGTRDQASQIPRSELVDANGNVQFVFAAPVNGFQNQQLFEARLAGGVVDAPVWINVNDVDRDGAWSATVLLPPRAPVRTWTGGSATSDRWSDPANWEENVAPLAGDDLVFPGTAVRFTGTNDFPDDTM